jgi:hypothetical protein
MVHAIVARVVAQVRRGCADVDAVAIVQRKAGALSGTSSMLLFAAIAHGLCEKHLLVFAQPKRGPEGVAIEEGS